MRPNIDLPWGIHGKVREYAETHKISIVEGYVKVLEKGLDELEKDLEE